MAKETKHSPLEGVLVRIAPLAIVVLACGSVTAAQVTSEVGSGEIRMLPPSDADRIQQSAERNNSAIAPKNFVKEETCLLPPLNLSTSAAVSARQLQVPANARKDSINKDAWRLRTRKLRMLRSAFAEPSSSIQNIPQRG
jgi:hypothetical protein